MGLNDAPSLLTPNEAADYLRLSVHTLKKWRGQDRGPPYISLGGTIRYDLHTLHSWVEANSASPSNGAQHD